MKLLQLRSTAIPQLVLAVLLLCFTACEKNDQPTPEAAKRFLQLRGYEFNEASFFKAAAAGDVLAVNGFLSAGIDPNVKNEDSDTALTASAARGDLKVVQALLKGGADLNAKGRNSWTAFLLAIEGEHDDVANAVIDQANLDLKAETPDGMTALMLAVWHQRTQLVRKLMQRGVELNHQDKDGDTAVHGAAWFGNAKILEMLLASGANPNLKNKLGGTALMWAASYGQDEAVRILLKNGADPKIKDIDGVTAAGWAAKNGRANLEIMLRAAERESAVPNP